MNSKMQEVKNTQIIEAVKYWLENTIVSFNFCPFAKKELINDSIHYEVVDEVNTQEQMLSLVHELRRLDKQSSVETTLLILPVGLESFFDYLDFLELANEQILALNYEGVYQLASFHPDYCFAEVSQNDPSNYTNRSPFPIIHIIREASLEKALAQYPEPENIPERNIDTATDAGVGVFQNILDQCIRIKTTHAD